MTILISRRNKSAKTFEKFGNVERERSIHIGHA